MSGRTTGRTALGHGGVRALPELLHFDERTAHFGGGHSASGNCFCVIIILAEVLNSTGLMRPLQDGRLVSEARLQTGPQATVERRMDRLNKPWPAETGEIHRSFQVDVENFCSLPGA